MQSLEECRHIKYLCSLNAFINLQYTLFMGLEDFVFWVMNYD